MNERQKLNFSTVFLYILLFTAMFSLYYVGRNGEPFGLALLYAMLVAGLNPVVSCLLYLLSGLSGFTLSVLPVYAGQAAILCIVFCVYAKLKKKAVAIPLVCVSLSLALFVAFSPFTPYNIPLNLPFTLGAISQKVILSGLIFLLSAMFTVSLKALLNKLPLSAQSGRNYLFRSFFRALRCRTLPNSQRHCLHGYCILYFIIVCLRNEGRFRAHCGVCAQSAARACRRSFSRKIFPLRDSGRPLYQNGTTSRRFGPPRHIFHLRVFRRNLFVANLLFGTVSPFRPHSLPVIFTHSSSLRQKNGR